LKLALKISVGSSGSSAISDKRTAHHRHRLGAGLLIVLFASPKTAD
jgi:hypothetical protein